MNNKAIALGALMLCSLVSPAAFADNLVINGGFETGDFTGWDVTWGGGDDYFAVEGGPGYYSAWFGSADFYDIIEQTLLTTPGVSYSVEFWLRHDANTPPEYPASFIARWNSDTVYTGMTYYTPDFVRVNLSVRAAGNDKLSFSGIESYAFYVLDNVSVSPIPEPGTLLLLGTGFAGLALMAVRKK